MVGLIALCQVQFLRAPVEGGGKPSFWESLFGAKPKRPRNDGDREDPTLRGRGLRTGGVDGGTGRVATTGPVRVTTPKGGGTAGGRGSSGGFDGTTVAGKSGSGNRGATPADAVTEGNVGRDSNFASRGTAPNPAEARLAQEKAETSRFVIQKFKIALTKEPKEGGLGKQFFTDLSNFKKSNPGDYEEINEIMDSFYESAEKHEIKPKDIEPAVRAIRDIVTKIKREQQATRADAVRAREEARIAKSEAEGKALEDQRAEALLKLQDKKAQEKAAREKKAKALRDRYNLPKGGN